MSLRRERALILALLLVLAAASWAILIWQSRVMNGMNMGLTMGMGAALFLAIWIVMMVAMMFPTTAPMILLFARVQRDRSSSGHEGASTWVFVGAYLLVWALFGVVAYVGALVASGLAQQAPWIIMNAARIGGGILVLSGLYQLTQIKRVCLAKCRTTQNFTLHAWRDSSHSSFHMGLEHGIYCLGCNWLLFVLLFPLGIMNIAAMALLTVLIFAEKVFPTGERIAQLAALALIFYGTLVIVIPSALPLSSTGM